MRKGRREVVKGSAWSGVLKGGLIGAVVALATTVVCAVLVTVAVHSERGGESGVLVCVGLGAMASGLAARRMLRERSALVGILSGGVTAAILSVSGLLLYGGIEMRRCGAIVCLCLCCGAITSRIGRDKNGRKNR